MAFGAEGTLVAGGLARSKNDITFSDFINSNTAPFITLGPVSLSSDFDGYSSISGGEVHDFPIQTQRQVM